MKSRTTILTMWIFSIITCGVVTACPIPVYQYSLEHWETDAYEITIYRGNQLSDDQQQALDLLERAQLGETTVANIAVAMRDTDTDNGSRDRLQNRIEVRYPSVTGIQSPVWSGELSLENVRALLSSPIRQRIGNALAQRVSAVWLLLESGDRNRDRDLENLLKEQTSRFEREIVVPDSAAWGGHDVQIYTDVSFEVIRVSRNDPAESMLVRMLLASEPDLESDFAGEPMVFPIYGRGLILYALVGRGINPWTLEEAANFLTGPCSCQIKAANPGTDLLMDVDWQARIEVLTPASVGETVGTGTFLRGFDEAEQENQ